LGAMMTEDWLPAAACRDGLKGARQQHGGEEGRDGSRGAEKGVTVSGHDNRRQ
ncbi:hypothetical protein AMTR_s00018p00235770, partial [Amborella trichopoda]